MSVPGAAAVMIAPDQGPVASFTHTAARAGVPSQFNGSASHDSDGTVARYDWNFGRRGPANNAGPNLAHVFARPGVYTVTLTVTDDSGCSTSFVFTGVTAYCNGGPAARRSQSVTVIGKPVVSTGPASTLTSHGATLKGTITPEGSATTYRFEYGTSTHYGLETSGKSAGAGFTARTISAAISGLQPGKTFYYRLVASNSAGTSDGSRRTFRTKSASAAAFTG
jgi:PKD repeat protein